jgi:hypothetical protein
MFNLQSVQSALTDLGFDAEPFRGVAPPENIARVGCAAQ